MRCPRPTPPAPAMTYCVALKIHDGMIFASDSRTNAGVDHVSTFTKMRVYEEPGERVGAGEDVVHRGHRPRRVRQQVRATEGDGSALAQPRTQACHHRHRQHQPQRHTPEPHGERSPGRGERHEDLPGLIRQDGARSGRRACRARIGHPQRDDAGIIFDPVVTRVAGFDSALRTSTKSPAPTPALARPAPPSPWPSRVRNSLRP